MLSKISRERERKKVEREREKRGGWQRKRDEKCRMQAHGLRKRPPWSKVADRSVANATTLLVIYIFIVFQILNSNMKSIFLYLR